MSTPISYLTQVLLNYYDETDIRVRTYPFTIDAQIFNLAANALEDLSLRYGREVNARFLETTPIQLDNQGVYYGARLPNTFVPPPDGSNPPLHLAKCTSSSTTCPQPSRAPTCWSAAPEQAQLAKSPLLASPRSSFHSRELPTTIR